MKLTKEEVLKRINSKCEPYVCPMCKKQASFRFSPEEFQHIGLERDGESLIIDGKINFIPILSGTCSNCGFIASFNLLTILED